MQFFSPVLLSCKYLRNIIFLCFCSYFIFISQHAVDLTSARQHCAWSLRWRLKGLWFMGTKTHFNLSSFVSDFRFSCWWLGSVMPSGIWYRYSGRNIPKFCCNPLPISSPKKFRMNLGLLYKSQTRNNFTALRWTVICKELKFFATGYFLAMKCGNSEQK
jgi:hypothetical protein